MLVTSLGYMLGRLTCCQMSLGPAGGTLFAALALGYYGVSLDSLYGDGERHLTIGTLGFVLFIYSVGFEAGPRFFSSIRTRNGWKFITMGVAVNVVAVLVCMLWAKVMKLDAATAAGMLSGALTSAPTYAAASQVGLDNTRLAVAFAIAYPIGLIGLVLLIQTLPSLLRQDLAKDAGAADEVEDDPPMRGEITRGFIIQKEGVFDRQLSELQLTRKCGVVLTRILRGDSVVFPAGDTELREGDRILAVGHLHELQDLEKLVGPETNTEELMSRMPASRRILVSNREVYGKSLADLALSRRHHCIVTHIERGSEDIDPGAEVRLLRNDIVVITGARDKLREVAGELGGFEPAINETNIAIYTGGIFIGLLIGSFHWHPLGLDFSLGTAVGLLIAGLFLGWIGRIGHYSTHVPKSARQLVRDLGILLFIGETGIDAGANLLEGLSIAPWQTLLGAAFTTTVVVLGTLLVGGRLLKLKALDNWGSLSGGLTSSAALQALRVKADSNEVTISYAAAYAIGSVAATIAGQLIAIWLR